MTKQERRSIATLLDQFAPLRGASHRDVVDYKVTVPMRFAEVQACLANGQTARLTDRRKFLGWQGYGPNPTILFDCGEQRVVFNTGDENGMDPKKFIAPDGGQVALHA